MDDDRLRRELERRATRASVPDFVTAVSPRLDSDRAQPARVAPWAPLAGLAAAAVIVVAVVIAFPRSPSTPAASAPAASTPAPSLTAVQPSVLDCGQLPPYAYLGVPVSTVSVVDSTGLIDSCSTELRQGTWPKVDTQAFVAGVPGQDEVEVAWNLQHCGPESVSVRVGSQGDKYAIMLVLDRLSAGGTACVDTITSKHVLLHVPTTAVAGLSSAPVSVAILAPSDDLTSRPTQVECSTLPGAAEDVAGSTLYDDTHLVTSCEAVEPGGGAYLTAVNPNGDERVVDVSWSATPCEAAPNVHVGKLPNGYFVHGALPKAPCSQPPVAQTLRIHLNAATAAGDVIVQFDRDGPTTSGQPPARVACTDAPDVTIVDVLGVIQSCAAGDGQVSPDEDIVASNPGGDKNALQISWLGPGAPCNYEVHLTKPGEHYQLDIYEMDDTCRQASIVRSVTLQLTTPIDAAQITGTSIGGAPGLRPSPGPSPTVEPTATAHSVACSDVMTLTDATGDVVSCADGGGRDYHSQDAHVSVDATDPRLLHIWWGQSYCTVSYDLSVTSAPSTLPQPADFEVSVFTTTDPECQTMPDAHAADIEFASPVDAGRVRLNVDGHSLADPVACVPSADLADAGNGVDIYDSTGLITGCIQRQPTSDPTGIPTNVTDSSVAVTWSDRPCGVPIHLMFDATSDGYALSKPGQCMVNPLMTYEVVINFVQPLSAQNVAAAINAPSK